jgi:hypothetical protein
MAKKRTYHVTVLQASKFLAELSRLSQETGIALLGKGQYLKKIPDEFKVDGHYTCSYFGENVRFVSNISVTKLHGNPNDED